MDVSHATRSCAVMELVWPQVSLGSLASVKEAGQDLSVINSPTTLVWEINVYMAPACQSMHFPTAVNVPRATVEFCVMKLKNSLTLANLLNVNMANADSQALGKPTVSATVAIPETAVIKKSLAEGNGSEIITKNSKVMQLARRPRRYRD